MNKASFYIFTLLGLIEIVHALPIRNAFLANRGQWDAAILFSDIGGRVVMGSNFIKVGSVLIELESGSNVAGKGIMGDGFSYFLGNDSTRWIRGVPMYSEVVYKSVHKGIDLIVRGMENGAISLQWRVHPGANPEDIRFKVVGEEIEISNNGLIAGEMVLSRVEAYQGTQRVPIQYEVSGNEVSFQVGKYDRGSELLIDPILVAIGGSEGDYGMDISYFDGYLYMVGSSYSPDFQLSGGYDTTYYDSSDVVVLKVDPADMHVVSGTFLGGRYDDKGRAIMVQIYGVYIAGSTYSPDFPVRNAFDSTYNGYGDAFVAKFSFDLSELESSTFLGSDMPDGARDIVVSGHGIYVTGSTQGGFPTTPDAYQHYGTYSDIFVSKLSFDLSVLLASSVIGGHEGYQIEQAYAMDVSSQGVFVTGSTMSDDFPVTPGAYSDEVIISEVFVIRLDLDLSELLAGTFIGGVGSEAALGVAVASDGVYVAGHTNSTDFPVTPGAFDETYSNGETDVFISKFDFNLSQLQLSTFLGGNDYDFLSDLKLASGGVYVVGRTWSTDFPITDDAFDPWYNDYGDAFISKLDLELSSLITSTYLGGSYKDFATAASLTPYGLIVIGSTESEDFPVTDDPGYPRGRYDIFLAAFPEMTAEREGDMGKDPVWYSGDELIFHLSHPAYIGYDIYDLSGRLIDRVSLGLFPSGTVRRDLREYGPGAYLIKVRIGNDLKTLKVVLR